MVLTAVEPRRVAERHFALIDQIVRRIEPDDPALRDWFAGYCREHRARLAVDLHLVEAHVAHGARVLEYGAVPLVMTAALTALGYDVAALDVRPDRFAAAIARLGLRVSRCDIETEAVPFESATFDVVLFNELFEHLRIDPVFTLAEAHRVLKPGGLLLLSTPNLRSFRGIRNLLIRNQGHAVSGGVHQQYEKLHTLGHMGHVREYTTREVSEFVVRIGFRVRALIFRGGHGRGAVGVAERLAPSLRPFFTLIASKAGPSDDPAATASGAP